MLICYCAFSDWVASHLRSVQKLSLWPSSAQLEMVPLKFCPPILEKLQLNIEGFASIFVHG